VLEPVVTGNEIAKSGVEIGNWFFAGIGYSSDPCTANTCTVQKSVRGDNVVASPADEKCYGCENLE
jgi:hypothetical protein